MNKNILLIAALLGSLAPQAQASFYVGAGVGYQYMDIDSVSDFNKGQTFNSNKDIEIPYTYADEFQGFSFLAGYRFKDSPWSVELNYFKSTTSKNKYETSLDVVTTEDVVSASTKIQVESFSIDVIGHYPLNNFNNVSLLGSIGVLHQKTNFVGEYDMAYTTAGIPDFDDVDNKSKRNIYDTRLKLGVGMQYSISEAISARAIFSVIPGGFSMTEGTPYLVNASLLYHF